MNSGYIGMGSNINSHRNFEKAVTLLRECLEVEKVSEAVVTKPIGIVNQADFLNGAVFIKTNKNADEVESLLKDIEDALGRDRTLPKFGPRTIDLDVVVWNDKVVDEDFYTRDFLRSCLAAIGFDAREG